MFREPLYFMVLVLLLLLAMSSESRAMDKRNFECDLVLSDVFTKIYRCENKDAVCFFREEDYRSNSEFRCNFKENKPEKLKNRSGILTNIK